MNNLGFPFRTFDDSTTLIQQLNQLEQNFAQQQSEEFIARIRYRRYVLEFLEGLVYTKSIAKVRKLVSRWDSALVTLSKCETPLSSWNGDEKSLGFDFLYTKKVSSPVPLKPIQLKSWKESNEVVTLIIKQLHFGLQAKPSTEKDFTYDFLVTFFRQFSQMKCHILVRGILWVCKLVVFSSES